MGNDRHISLDGETCVVLAGGLGTRLRSVLPEIPKPMAPIRDKPFLEHLLCWIARSGIRRAVLSSGYRHEIIEEYFRNGESVGLELIYSVEQKPLGTWGALRQASRHVDRNEFIALNGDSWLEVDLCQLFNFHINCGGVATLAAAHVMDSSRFGSLQMNLSGRILRFNEKSAGGDGWINGGIYVLSQRVFGLVPMEAMSLEKQAFPRLVEEGIYALKAPGIFVDIGLPEEYMKLESSAEEWMTKLHGTKAC